MPSDGFGRLTPHGACLSTAPRTTLDLPLNNFQNCSYAALTPAPQVLSPADFASNPCTLPDLARIFAQADDSVRPGGEGIPPRHAAPRCNFYKPDGRRCGSPAVRGRRRCYFHQRLFTPARRDYSLPPIEDAHSLHAAVLQVLRAIADGAVSPHDARLMLYGAQIAASNLKNLLREDDHHFRG